FRILRAMANGSSSFPTTKKSKDILRTKTFPCESCRWPAEKSRRLRNCSAARARSTSPPGLPTANALPSSAINADDELLVLRRVVAFQFIQKPFARPAQLLLQLRRTIAITTRPRLGPILVPAILSGVRIFHGQ